MKLFALAALSTAAVAQIPDFSDWLEGKDYKCPDYADIRQDTVKAENFDINDFAGQWYLAATNEPTIPPICKCGVNNVTVDQDKGEYEYTCTLKCVKPDHFSLTMKGEISKDPEWPGDLKENAAIFDHRIAPLVPNMLFHAVRDDSGNISHAYTYACIGKVPPVFGKELFSFNLLTRSDNYTTEQLTQMVQDAVDLVGDDVFRMDAIKYTSK